MLDTVMVMNTGIITIMIITTGTTVIMTTIMTTTGKKLSLRGTKQSRRHAIAPMHWR